MFKVSPNRPNIYLRKEQRSGTPGDEGYEELLTPLAIQLKEKREEFPLCLVYFTKIRLCGLAYNVFERTLGDEQYVGVRNPSSRLFNQFHASSTDEMKSEMLREIVKPNSKLRVLFATSALGMGVDIPHVETVIHIGPPSTMEMYMQQIGRAARGRPKADAILYWNNADIGNNITHMSDEMRRFCRSKECVRKQLVNHFGFEVTEQKRCCSECKAMDVDVCKKMSAMNLPKIVRDTPMSRPLLVREIDCIIARWRPDQAVVNLFDVQPLPHNISELIADDAAFISGVDYIFDTFEIWDAGLAQDLFDCVVRHTSI